MRINYEVVSEDSKKDTDKNILERGIRVKDLLQKDWLFSIGHMPDQYEVPIKRVSVIELRDFSAWLLGNELALTTIQNFPTLQLQKSLVYKLAQGGAACVAFHPGQDTETDQKIFSETIAYAQEINFPILLLNHTTTYSEVIDEVFKIELETQSQHIGAYSRINQELFHYISDNSDLSHLIQAIGQETEREMMLTDITLAPLAYSDGLEKSHLAELLTHASFQKFINKPDINTLLINGYVLHITVTTSEDESLHMMLVPVNKDYYLQSFMFVLGRPDSLLIDKVLKDIVVALQMEKRSTQELDFDLMNSASRDLLVDYNPNRANDQFQKLGISIEDKVDLFVMDVSMDRKRENQEDVYYIKNLKSRIKRNVDRYLVVGNSSVWFENTLVFLIDEKSQKHIVDITKQIEKIMEQFFSFVDVHIGVSSFASIDLHSLYKEAMYAINIGKENNKRVTTFNELGLLQLFTDLNRTYYLERYYKEVLQPLLNLEQDRKNELLITLNSFIDHNLNYKDTASDLFVHPNTIRYRMKQIEEIYNKENILENSEHRFSIQMALKLMKLI